MVVVLIGLGVVLVVLGAVVLFRHPDRPGGTIKLLGLEVTSTGAGLPLIALGAACVVFAVTRTTGGREATPSDSATVATPLATRAADCPASVFPDVPRDRIATVETGMRSVPVIGAHQTREAPFGLVLTANGQRVAALRIRLHAGATSGADLYRIEAAVDGACTPLTELHNDSRGGDPTAILNWDTLRFRAGDRNYAVRIGGEGGQIAVGSFTAVQ